MSAWEIGTGTAAVQIEDLRKRITVLERQIKDHRHWVDRQGRFTTTTEVKEGRDEI